MAGRPELCLSRPGEREPEPPHGAANLTNGQLGLHSHQPKLLQESPEKWHHRGDTLLGTGWRGVLKDEKKKVRAEWREAGPVIRAVLHAVVTVWEEYKGQIWEERCQIACFVWPTVQNPNIKNIQFTIIWNFHLTSAIQWHLPALRGRSRWIKI